jgi:hypothetical protein
MPGKSRNKKKNKSRSRLETFHETNMNSFSPEPNVPQASPQAAAAASPQAAFQLNAQNWPNMPKKKPKTPPRSPPRSPPRVFAPTDETDPRFLGLGASKLVWSDDTLFSPTPERNRLVVVNALNSQIFDSHATTDAIRAEQLAEKKAEQIREFHFSHLMSVRFPGLVPKVYALADGAYHPTDRYRYSKEYCEPVVKDTALFHTMIQICDDMVDQGWVYLDMKPGNLGLLHGRTVLIDTDPESFYMIPHDPANHVADRIYYKNACRMIILLFCLNYIPAIPVQVLHDYARRVGFTEQKFRATFDYTPVSRTVIARFNNDWFAASNQPIQLVAADLLHPITFITHYGNVPSRGIHALTRLKSILDYRP